MKNPIFICLAIIALTIQSCYKDKDPTKRGKQKHAPPHEYYEVWMGEAADYMYFKKGSWWVYKNMQTNKLDTHSITISRFDTINAVGNYGFRTIKYDKVSITTRSSQYGQFYEWFSRENNPDLPPSYTSVWVKGKSPGGSNSPSFFTPLRIFDRGDVALVTLDTIMTLESGITYINVQKFKIYEDASYPHILDPNNNSNYYSLIYYAKNYGIIKYEFPEFNKSIELKESHLIQ